MLWRETVHLRVAEDAAADRERESTGRREAAAEAAAVDAEAAAGDAEAAEGDAEAEAAEGAAGAADATAGAAGVDTAAGGAGIAGAMTATRMRDGASSGRRRTRRLPPLGEAALRPQRR
jgi:hypothetical protein